MKAVIMAGGEGKRLRPLTCDIPKPMARLCGRPAIEHIIYLLRENGVDEAAVTLRYLPEKIRENFTDGSYLGVKLHFLEEDKPLGTAGGVLNAAQNFKDDFIVISGDAMCDFDLRSAVRLHREKHADATLVLSRVADPREYGLVVTDASGNVKGFVEKPGWAQAVTDAVNTGIYILNVSALRLIPKGQPFDFAKDLFPLMLDKGLKVCGFEAEGYWCDIGDIGAYTSCQFDMLDNRVDCRLEGQKRDGIYFKNKIPKGNYSIIPPVYIGESVRIGDYSQIGPFAVIDDGCTIGIGASVKNSVMLPESYAGDYAELRGALVCAGASLKKRVGMYEGSVAGEGCVIGTNASVSPGVRIWPGKVIDDGVRVAANVKTGNMRHGLFDDDGITGEPNADLTPETCAKLGAAIGGIFESGRIGIGSDGSAAGTALKNAVIAGTLSSGTEICDFGSCFESLFNFAVTFFELNAGVFVRMAGNRAVIELTGAGGLGLGRAAERKIESAMTTGEISRCRPEEYSEPFVMQGVKAVYQRELGKSAPQDFEFPVSVRSANREIQKMLIQVLKQSGCPIETGKTGNICLHSDVYGTHASFICEDGTFLSQEQSLALGCMAAFENGEDVALPFSAPRIIDVLAKRYGCRVLRYLECPTDGADSEARKLALKQTWVRDGLENALRILSFANGKNRTLACLKSSLPRFAVSVKSFSCEVNPGLLLNTISGKVPAQPSEGVALTRGKGRVLISPLKRGTGLRITAEAGDMETAGELCSDVARELQNCIKTIDNNGKKS